MDIPEQELRIDVYRAATGGAVRIMHIPTGFSVTVDFSPFRAQTTAREAKEEAMRMVVATLKEEEK